MLFHFSGVISVTSDWVSNRESFSSKYPYFVSLFDCYLCSLLVNLGYVPDIFHEVK